MKLIGHIERIERHEIEMHGDEYVQTREELIASVPAGYTLVRISRHD